MLRPEIIAALVIATLTGCGAHTASPAGHLDAGHDGDASPSIVVACNDGTGKTDCCPQSAISGASCKYAGPPCSTRCTNGQRGQMSCSGGTWLAGHGLFPCDMDASVQPDDAATCTDANVQMIKASSYDQTCTTSSDCVGVGEGNTCLPCLIACPNAAINVSAKASYLADVAMTNAGQGSQPVCHCPKGFPPCCIAGACHADDQCSIGGDQ